MRTTTDSVFHSIGEFTDRIGSNNIAVGEPQISWLWWVLDPEGERESNLVLYGPTRHSAELNTPLLYRFHRRVYEQRITGNRL